MSIDVSLVVRELVARSARAARVAVVEGRRGSQDLGTALRALHSTWLPTGSFVFVVSDFLGELDARHWLRLRARAWDVTPVVVQDPTWEQSFPAVGGIAIPFVDAAATLSADEPIGTSALFDANDNEIAWVVLRFRPFEELSTDEVAMISTGAVDADVHVDARYGTFDPVTGQVVALG